MGNFGEEMVTVNALGTQPIPDDVSVTQRLIDVAQIPAPKFLYFHPRVYVFDGRGSETLRPYHLPDGRVGRVLVFPERHTLWFARGATIRLEPNMVIIIRGSIRAERTTLFDLPEVRNRRSDREGLPGSALVRIERARVDTIDPEWFGAQTVNGARFSSPNDAPRGRGLRRAAGRRYKATSSSAEETTSLRREPGTALHSATALEGRGPREPPLPGSLLRARRVRPPRSEPRASVRRPSSTPRGASSKPMFGLAPRR